MNDKKTFKPETKTLFELFAGEMIYTIPNYQRQFSWGIEQLEELWNDLSESFMNDFHECYFLGSIVVVKKGKKEQELVDGQQRMTTLMIMLHVLAKSFPTLKINKTNGKKKTMAKDLIFINEEVNRLRLQVDPNYHTIFDEVIIKREDYASFSYPTIKELKKDEPRYKFILAAKFFYERFWEFQNAHGLKKLDAFVDYILYQINVIKIICYNESYAIKLFLVLNDRGLELAASDIVKSYILDRYDSSEQYNDYDKKTFETNWKAIEKICNDCDVKLDEFLVFFEYFKLKSNPKRQVTEELKKIIQQEEINSFVNELMVFADNMEKIYIASSPVILSLRYIPWNSYVMTALLSAYQVNYKDKAELFELIRRFFYICFISGKTLNGIKQTSFRLIQMIGEKKSVEEIKDMLDHFIYKEKLIKMVYEVLKEDVYEKSFLKPLILSIEYKMREDLDTCFYKLNSKIHIDHILPQKFDKKREEWENIKDVAQAKLYLDKLGNMALLQGSKNEEALNHGMEQKIRIYEGHDKNKSGVTTFNTTKVLIDQYHLGDTLWDVSHIIEREKYLLELIEDMLDISEEEKDIVIEDERPSRYYKWLYKGEYITNKKLVLQVLKDYLEENHIMHFKDIEEEIREFKMYSHKLVLEYYQEDDETYHELITKNIKIYVETVCQYHDTLRFIEMMKKYYSFEVKKNGGQEEVN